MSNPSTGEYAPEKDDVLAAAEGGWGDIFRQLAPALSAAHSKPGRNFPCPVHGGRDGFKIFRKTAGESSGGVCRTCGIKADGLALLMWINKWSFHKALQEVGTLFGVKDPYGRTSMYEGTVAPVRRIPASRPVPAPVTSGPSDEWIHKTLRKLWQESLDLTHPDAEPARLYLRSRGIMVWDRPDLSRFVRFHPSLSYKAKSGERSEHPGILAALISPKREAVTLQRYYLTSKGEKAPVDEPKMMFCIPSDRTLPGCAIPTARPGEVLDVCEGLETALAIETGRGVPVWPLVNTYLMEQFVPPPVTKAVRIWADKDRKGAGITSANVLKKRLWEMGIKAQILLPDLPIPDGCKGVDWNDVLLQCGPAGFPGREAYRATR